MLIGMFHKRKDPNTVSRAYLYASFAEIEGFEFLYFTAKGVNFETRTIEGQVYKDGKWQSQTCPFPDFVLNVAFPITPKQEDVYYKLRTLIPFVTYPVGSKLSIYQRIQKGDLFSKYLIPYEEIKSIPQVLRFMKEHNRIIIKPSRSNHGKGVIFIEEQGDHYLTHIGNEKKVISQIEFIEFLEPIVMDKSMIIQKYINCKRKDGASFDIRAHVQKNDAGKWEVSLIFPRIAQKDKVVTNLSLGALVKGLDKFLDDEYREDAFNMKRYLEVFATSFAAHFETLYNHPFDELGIDIGIDEEKKIWLYEVNIRPDRRYLQAKAARLSIQYVKFLAEQKKEVPDDETTPSE